MLIELDFPLSVNEHCQIVDNAGGILTPPLIWRMERAHIARQTELAKHFCELANRKEAEKKKGDLTKCAASAKIENDGKKKKT